MYSRSLFVWVVVGGFFGDGLYFAISKVYESRFNGSHRQRSYQLTFASNPPCSAFPKSTFMPCNLAIRWTIDSPSPLPVAVCPGGLLFQYVAENGRMPVKTLTVSDSEEALLRTVRDHQKPS